MPHLRRVTNSLRRAHSLAWFVISLCLIGLLLAPSQALAQSHVTKAISQEDFIWQTNLRDAGFEPAAVPYSTNGQPVADAVLRVASSTRIGYVDDKTIFVSYVRQNQVGGLQRRDDPNRTRPYTLHAVLFDAASGKVIAKREWPSDIPDAFIFPRDDGQYLLFDAEHVASFSSDGTQTGELVLQGPKKDILQLWGVSVSATGKTLFVQFHGEHRASCEWVYTDSMTETVANCVMPPNVAITDSRLAFFKPDPKAPQYGGITSAKLGEGWSDVCDAKTMPACRNVRFMDGNLLVYDHKDFALLGDRNEVSFEQKQAEILFLTRFVAAGNSPRFAALFLSRPSPLMPTATPGFAFARSLDGMAKLVVYDPTDEKSAAAIEFKSPPQFASAMALSPDATHALIFNGSGFLRAYSIPEFLSKPSR